MAAQKTEDQVADKAVKEARPTLEERETGSVEEKGAETRSWQISVKLPGFLLRKAVLFTAAGVLLLMLAGWGYLAGRGAKEGNDARMRPTSKTAVADDGLRREDLSRFYIPVPQNGPNLVLVIDFSVVWDAVAAVRYRKMEVPLRNRLYESLSRLAAREEGLQDNIPMLEEEMERVFRESLRADALSVKISEVKAF